MHLRCRGLFVLIGAMQEPPLTDAAIVELARALLDLDIPTECLPGVRANLAVLAGHAELVGQVDD